MMVDVGHFLSRGWDRLRLTFVKAAALVYSNPDVVVLPVSMFAGILLSAGMDLIARVFDDEVRKPGTAQLVGLFFLLSGMASFWAAWSAQQFRTELTNGRERFENWRGRGLATLALFLAFAFLAVALTLLLALAALKDPSTVAPRVQPTCTPLHIEGQ